jgi:hypothetical protein
LQKRNGFPVTIIEIRPYRNGWQVYERARCPARVLKPGTSDLSLQILCVQENHSFPYDLIWIDVCGPFEELIEQHRLHKIVGYSGGL